MAKSIGIVLFLPFFHAQTVLETLEVSESGEYEVEFCTIPQLDTNGICNYQDRCFDFIATNVTHELVVWFGHRFDVSSEDPNRSLNIDESTITFGPQPNDYDYIEWSGSGENPHEQPTPLDDPHCNDGTRVVIWRWETLDSDPTFAGIMCNHNIGFGVYQAERIRICIDVVQDQGGWGEFHGNHGTVPLFWDVIPPPEPAKDVTYDVAMTTPVATVPFVPAELVDVDPIEFEYEGPPELKLTCENLLAVYQLSVVTAGEVVDIEGVTCAAITTTRSVMEVIDDQMDDIVRKCGDWMVPFWQKTHIQQIHCKSKNNLRRKKLLRSTDTYVAVDLVWTVGNVPEDAAEVTDAAASPVFAAITSSTAVEVTDVVVEPPVAIEPVDECEHFECNGSGQCFDQAIGYYCTCNAGYSGEDCETSVCDSYTGCSHVCYVSEGNPTCACGQGQTSVNNVCEDPDAVCQAFGCSDGCGYQPDNSPACYCPENKYMLLDGKTCQQVSDICATGVCQKGCSNTTPSLPQPLEDQTYTCSCGLNEVVNMDGSCSVNACNASPCEDTCILDDTVTDGFRCECAAGTSLQDDGFSCSKDVCLNVYCSHDCVVDQDTGAETCVCPAGRTLNPADDTECVDISVLCDGFGCSDICMITNEEPTCLCNDGREMGSDGKTCVDILCYNNGPCQQICTVSNGAEWCQCSDGYEGDGFVCTPVQTDPCADKGCNQACYLANDQPTCACKKGMKLDTDGLTCIEKQVNTISEHIVREDTTIRPYGKDYCIHKRYSGFAVNGLVSINFDCKIEKIQNHWKYVAGSKQIKSIGAESKGKDLCLTTKDTVTNTLRLTSLQNCDETDDKQAFDLVGGEIRLASNPGICLWWSSTKNLEFIKTKGCNWKQNFMYLP